MVSILSREMSGTKRRDITIREAYGGVMYHTSVSGFVAQQHLHLPVLLQRLQQDVALLVEEEEDRQGDVVCVAAVPCHLKQGSGVAAAALVVVWKGAKGDQ